MDIKYKLICQCGSMMVMILRVRIRYLDEEQHIEKNVSCRFLYTPVAEILVVEAFSPL